MFEAYTRDQLRRTYGEAWQKRLAGVPLSPLEVMLADIIGLHPEYQRAVRSVEAAQDVQGDVTLAAENPFLHMGLHMAVREQLAIDRPPGVRDVYARLQMRLGAEHAAEHALMEALAEALWEAQSSGRPPDETRYLALARGHCKP